MFEGGDSGQRDTGQGPSSKRRILHASGYLEIRRSSGTSSADVLEVHQGPPVASEQGRNRSRPYVVATWNDIELARRWLLLYPKRKKPDKSPEEPNEFELNSIRNDPDKLACIRTGLKL